jgi:uncharacterized protein YndB with AHSA1/START domain
MSKHPTKIERTSERELVVTRTFDAPAALVFEAWTTPALMMRWWAPKSVGMKMTSCEIDARTGGTYRLVFEHAQSPEPMAFHGRYLEVVPGKRLRWTNEESGEGGQISTVTFEEKDGKTYLVLHELYPTKEALDAEMESGALACTGETHDQLDALLTELGTKS